MAKGDDKERAKLNVPSEISPEWYMQQYWRHQPAFEKIQRISKKMGKLKLDIPEYDVESGTQYRDLFMSQGRQQADAQARSLSDALAARGGGGLGSAVALGAQARKTSMADLMSAGISYDFQKYQQDLADYMTRLNIAETDYGYRRQGLMDKQQGLLDALTFRFNILNQALSAKMGQYATNMQYRAAHEGTEAALTGAKWGAISNLFAGRMSQQEK